MIRINILYPNVDGGRFDFDYYLKTHMPMSIRLLGPALKDVAIERGLSGQPETSAAYIAMCHLTFDTIEAFMAAFMPHAETLQGDIPNYTNIQPVIQMSKIEPLGA